MLDAINSLSKTLPLYKLIQDNNYQYIDNWNMNSEDFKSGSHMVKHWMTPRPEDQSWPPFKFKILGGYRDCLSRQVAEAIKIQNIDSMR